MTEQERYVLFLVRRYSRLSVSLFGSMEDAAQELWAYSLAHPNPYNAWKANFCRCFSWLIGRGKARQKRSVVCVSELAEPACEHAWPDCDREVEVAMRAVKKYLPQRNQEIVLRHYGIGRQAESLRSIAKQIGLSDVSVSRINRESLETLRNKLDYLQ